MNAGDRVETPDGPGEVLRCMTSENRRWLYGKLRIDSYQECVVRLDKPSKAGAERVYRESKLRLLSS